MAPPDRQPNPGHPAGAGLDPEFGHVGEIAAWAEWLLHPETHDYDRMIILSDGHKVEHRGRALKPTPLGDPNGPMLPDPPVPDEYYPYESVIQGCSVEQFFDPAHALSGQQFGDHDDLGRIFQVLMDMFWVNDNWDGKLIGGLTDLREKWHGDAAANAGEFLGGVHDFLTDFDKVAHELAAIALAYGGIVTVARTNLNDAMGKLVDAFHAKFYAQQNPWETVLLNALSAVAAGALTYVTGGTALAAFGSGLGVAIDKALTSSDGDTHVGGGTWRELVDNYFVAQMKILQRAQTEIENLEHDLVRLAGRLAEIPKLPAP